MTARSAPCRVSTGPKEPDIHASSAAAASLSTIDLRTIDLSRRDPASSVRTPTFRDRLCRSVVGGARPRALSNARLEALRRYAVIYRIAGAPGADVDRQARSAGFTEDQLALVRLIVDRSRPRTQSASRRLTIAGAILGSLLITLGAGAWLSRQLDNPVVASIVIGITLLTLASLASTSPQRSGG
jgi:hypothetical protein